MAFCHAAGNGGYFGSHWPKACARYISIPTSKAGRNLGGTVESQGPDQGTGSRRLVSGADQRESPAVPPREEGGYCNGGWEAERRYSAGDAECNPEASGPEEVG